MFVYLICLYREKKAGDSQALCTSNLGTVIFCTSNLEIFHERATNEHRNQKCSNIQTSRTNARYIPSIESRVVTHCLSSKYENTGTVSPLNTVSISAFPV